MKPKLVVSDTSAITSLIQVGMDWLLGEVFSSVIVPKGVAEELRRHHFEIPTFLKVIEVKNRALVAELMQDIDGGEAEAIVVAEEIGADLLVVDDAEARSVAMARGLQVTGVLGVLIIAKDQGHLESVSEALTKLERIARFRVSARLKEQVLRAVGEWQD